MRLERPMSTTTDSWLRRTRVTLQSHAMRWSVSLRVARVPVGRAFVVELARRVFGCEGKQLVLVERFADRTGRPRHHGEMGEADLPLPNRLHALRQLGHPLSDRDPIAHRVARQVAVDTNPVVGGGRALPVPEIRLDEF